MAARAWSVCERAWLEHLTACLGDGYRLDEGETARLLSSLSVREAQATLDFMEKTPPRIVRVLEGVAAVAPWGKDLLIVFDDQDTYYRYVARHYPDSGEFGFSSGMHLHDGPLLVFRDDEGRAGGDRAGHRPRDDACVPGAPADPGVAQRRARGEHRAPSDAAAAAAITPQQVHRMHLRFWNAETVQEFWSGRSFLRSDQGQMLSYELAATIVEQLAKSWPPFRDFAREASLDDAGAASARRHFDLDLGALVSALVERGGDPAWSPDPRRWNASPERGAFA